jgi:hypothetical protein
MPARYYLLLQLHLLFLLLFMEVPPQKRFEEVADGCVCDCLSMSCFVVSHDCTMMFVACARVHI